MLLARRMLEIIMSELAIFQHKETRVRINIMVDYLILAGQGEWDLDIVISGFMKI